MPQPPVTEISLKITNLKVCSNLPEANELNGYSILQRPHVSYLCETGLNIPLCAKSFVLKIEKKIVQNEPIVLYILIQTMNA